MAHGNASHCVKFRPWGPKFALVSAAWGAYICFGIADALGMPALTSSTPLLAQQRVRFRCLTCEVAWTAEDDTGCWICGEPGHGLRSALALREDDHLHLDFQ